MKFGAQQTQPITSISLILTLPKWHLATYEAACLVSTKQVVKKNNSRQKKKHINLDSEWKKSTKPTEPSELKVTKV